MNAEADKESILPYIKMFQQLIRWVQFTVVTTTAIALCSCQSAVCRRRPFLIKSLENTLSKLLKSLDFYDNAARHKVAIGTISEHPDTDFHVSSGMEQTLHESQHVA